MIRVSTHSQDDEPKPNVEERKIMMNNLVLISFAPMLLSLFVEAARNNLQVHAARREWDLAKQVVLRLCGARRHSCPVTAIPIAREDVGHIRRIGREWSKL